MAKPKSKHPLTSFDSSLLDALIQGGLKQVEIQFPTAKDAVHCRHRMHSLRAAMRREDRPDWEQFYRAGIHIHPTDPRVLIIRPRDSEFREAFEAAGIKLTGGGEPPAPPQDTKIATEEDVEKFLRDLRNLK